MFSSDVFQPNKSPFQNMMNNPMQSMHAPVQAKTSFGSENEMAAGQNPNQFQSMMLGGMGAGS